MTTTNSTPALPEGWVPEALRRVHSAVAQYRNAPFRSADWLAGELMTILDTIPANDVPAAPSPPTNESVGTVEREASTLAERIRAAVTYQYMPMAVRKLLCDAEAEITRLRELLVDPGNPAWENARGVLAAEMRKAGFVPVADRIADAQPEMVPSDIALNLIALVSQSRSELMEALEPFAQWAKWAVEPSKAAFSDRTLREAPGILADFPDDYVISPQLAPGEPKITLGQTRRARQALQAMEAAR